MNEINLRLNVIELLKSGSAHLGLNNAIENLDPELRNKKPNDNLHSVWELLDHIRIGQEDILHYLLNPNWKSPDWPKGYWPDANLELTDKIWKATIKNFNNDLSALIDLAKNENIDLTSEIPHGEGRTYLRELLLAADHNSYHVGQIIETRKALNAWK